MADILIPEDTTFTFDVLGRYSCNTLDEAIRSTSGHPDARPFDQMVIGGGSFGAVIAARLFNLDRRHEHRILVLEAGPFALPEHVQNLPPSFDIPGKGQPGTLWGTPWVSDSPMTFNQNFPGLAYCVGGRSVFWGGWSPYFLDSEVADASWPANVRNDLMTPVLPHANPVESYLDRAARQIGTDQTNDFVNGPLHDAMRNSLFTGLQQRAAAAEPGADVLTGNRGSLTEQDDVEAPLAVASASGRPGSFASNKFSGVQLLLRAARVAQAEAEHAAPGGPSKSEPLKRLMLVDNVHVTRLERSGNRITRLFVKRRGDTIETPIEVPPAGRVFLALGTIENTRMVLNAVPEKSLVGHNLMAHLRSNFTLRVRRSAFGAALDPEQQTDELLKQKLRELQVSALFVKGIHTHGDGSKGHYHLQITASGVGELGMNSEAELFKKIPSIDELDQFRDLTDPWVVITIRGIGEMVGDKFSDDPVNRIARGPLDGNGVARAQVRLETNWFVPSDPRATDPNDPKRTKDNDLWNAMDAASDAVAAMFANGGPVQYLSRPNDAANAHWQSTPPPNDLRRDTLGTTHHEAGTLWMGENAESSVTDELGRVWELQNLYAVGPALLPTIGSPNPMLSGVALARRTADRLVPLVDTPPAENGFTWLFDGTEKTFQRWRGAGQSANALYFALKDSLLVAQPIGDQAVLYYAAERYSNFILRLQFRITGTPDVFGKVPGNSGVFLRFREPHRAWADVNQIEPKAGGNPAWVASVTGFEVQIDEQGAPSFFDRHRTGAIYDIPENEQSYTPGPVLQSGVWYEYEIEVNGDAYHVRLKKATQAAYQDICTFHKGSKYAQRGLPFSADSRSGHIGIQAHPGNGGRVAFRNIRLRKLAD